MFPTQNDTKTMLTALKAYIGNTKSSFNPDEILKAISQNSNEIIRAISRSESKILGSIDQAVFDKQLLVDILGGTCENLTGDAITAIADYVFYNKLRLKTIDLPNCISIGRFAFYSCKGLTSLNLPNLSRIEEAGFMYCTGLTSIDLPNLNIIVQTGFLNCTGLTSLNLPNLSRIGISGFESCEGLTSIDLPMLRNIQQNAFKLCKGLRKVFIPKECTTINAPNYLSSAFYVCTNTELKIFCEATEKPSGWGTYWNYISDSAQATVVWGATHEDYEAY